MLILSQNFWRIADGTCFVYRYCALIMHSPEIKMTSVRSAMSPVTQHVSLLPITIKVFSRIIRVWETFSYSFLMGQAALIQLSYKKLRKVKHDIFVCFPTNATEPWSRDRGAIWWLLESIRMSSGCRLIACIMTSKNDCQSWTSFITARCI